MEFGSIEKLRERKGGVEEASDAMLTPGCNVLKEIKSVGCGVGYETQ